MQIPLLSPCHLNRPLFAWSYLFTVRYPTHRQCQNGNIKTLQFFDSILRRLYHRLEPRIPVHSDNLLRVSTSNLLNRWPTYPTVAVEQV